MSIKDTSKSCPVPLGILLVIGGNESKSDKSNSHDGKENDSPMEILKDFVKLMGKDNPNIEVVTTGSAEAEETFSDYKKAFSDLGIEQVGQIHHNHRSEILATDLDTRIAKADGIFFSGGDQLKLTSIYGGTFFLLQLKERYIYDTLVLAGTSAGAMAFSTPMIFAGNKENQQLVGEVNIATGLEFLKDVCIDTHFVDRSRFVRMAQVVATNPTSIGIGIEEDTAVVVRKGVEFEVIGSGVVTIIEGYTIMHSNITKYGTGEAIAIEDLTVKLLSKGSHYRSHVLNPPHF